LEHRLAVDKTATLTMVMLCLIWSAQQIALKAVAHDISPVMQIALRSAGASVLVALLMRWRKEAYDWSVWRPGTLVAALFAAEFLFAGEALRYTSASHVVVFLYTAPIFAALGLHAKLPSERLDRIQWLGIALAFAGVAASFLSKNTEASRALSGTSLFGDFLALLGGIAWAATTVLIRTTRLTSTSPTQTLLFQLLGAAVILLGAAVLGGHASVHFSKVVVASLLFQTVVVSFISFLTWFWLLRTYLASRLGVFTFMTPVFGVVLGVLVLDEPLDAGFMVGALMVMAGIFVVSAHTMLAKRRSTHG
jgi:drug/metabolite transporter (DMT)-like permease